MPKGKPVLVTRFLENIGRDGVEKYQKLLKSYTDGQPGIYALYSNNRLYYVGLAADLSKRLKEHLRDRHAATWDKFSVYLTETDSHLSEIEALLVRIAAPKGNKQVCKLSLAENLVGRFKKSLQEEFRKETKKLIRKQKCIIKKT
jgi:predicted GIY-YIG superfamily endonuclease